VPECQTAYKKRVEKLLLLLVIEERAAGAFHHVIEATSLDVKGDSRLTTYPNSPSPMKDPSGEGGTASECSHTLRTELITRERIRLEVGYDEYHGVLVVS
jgi:hypothetical protein